MIQIGALLLTALAHMVAPAAALEVREEPVAVLELFTSQGCSSCPPADIELARFGARKDIVALAYHVDYWDYAGWADTFGDPVFSAMQRRYASAWGKARVYTPQLVINGVVDVVGSRRVAIETELAAATLSVPVSIAIVEDLLDVRIPAAAGVDCTIWLVRFRSGDKVAVRGGENGGRVLGYSHIVTGRQVLGMAKRADDEALHFKLPLTSVFAGQSDGVAVLVQEDRNGYPGPMIGAASLIQ